ncbi:hypothetical protein [Lapidilactobacillus dextrinicus]|uniref:hypothetical protein n=1 Tax=Lapidilactobacillus dextrinicus TaxID=51664 RepID=UPI0022E50565|nr:hypothetical protein [Lapidilactobacillus dextrinicus]
MTQNLEIRNTIKDHRLRYWEVAEQIGISDSRLSVWLRTPLTDKRKERVEEAINELLAEVSKKTAKEQRSCKKSKNILA